MPAEIEAKFLNIDRDDLRVRLRAAGYDCVQPDYLMRRVVFDLPGDDRAAWARVRDEGGRIAVTYKCTHDITRIDGTEEIEITVDHFDNAVALLEAFGLVRKSYQETRREIWEKGDVEVVLDEWPAISPFIEIEAPDETAVRAAAAELGFDWGAAKFGAVGVVYETVGISHGAINACPRITFDNVDDVLALRQSQKI